MLAPRLGPVLDPRRGDGQVLWLEALPDPGMLADRLARSQSADEPFYLVSRSGDLELMERAKSLLQVMGL